MQQHLDFFIRNQRDQIRPPILVDILNGQGSGIGFEIFTELLRPHFAVRRAGYERAMAVLIHNHAKRRLRAGLQCADGHHERFAVERNERWKRQPAVFIKLRHADRVFVAAQEKNTWMAVAIPIRRRELAHAGQGGKGLGRGERTIRLLEINRKLAAGRLRHEQIGTSVAVDIGPKQAALRRVRLVQRQNLKLSAPECAGQNFGGLARELRNRRAAGIPRNGHDVIFAVTFEGIRAKRAQGRCFEINFRPKLTGGVLQPEPQRCRAVPIHQQQIVPAVAVHIHNLHGFGRARARNFLRLAERVVRQLRQEIQRAVVAEQNQVGPAIPIQITCRQRIRVQLSIHDVPAFRLAPAIGAFVVNHLEVLRIAVKSDVGTAVAVEIGYHHRAQTLVGGNGIDAKTRAGRQFIDFEFARRAGGGGPVGFARLIVKQIDF